MVKRRRKERKRKRRNREKAVGREMQTIKEEKEKRKIRKEDYKHFKKRA